MLAKKGQENGKFFMGESDQLKRKELRVLTRLFCVLQGQMIGKNIFPAFLSGILNLELTSVRENTTSYTYSILFPTISVVEGDIVYSV